MNIVGKIIDIIKGIGGVSTDEEFVNELIFRLQALNNSNPIFYNKGIGYLIKDSPYAGSGSLDEIALSEEAIKHIIENSDDVIKAQGVVGVEVDLDKCEIKYTYKDWDDEIEEKLLYISKVKLI